MNGVPPGAWWLIAAAALAALEMVAPGIYLIWIALAALITGVAAFVLPIDLGAQLLIFALATAQAVFVGHHWFRAKGDPDSEDPALNEYGDRVVGAYVTTVTAVDERGGRVRLGDSEWNAVGPTIPAGASARVTGVEGTRLRIVPATAALSEPDGQRPAG